eukprot:COSAG02_NODE_23986_length_701_cov_4.262458_1_plen_52_part_10
MVLISALYLLYTIPTQPVTNGDRCSSTIHLRGVTTSTTLISVLMRKNKQRLE